ncbi:MAG: imelysin family protein [Terrimicrobiaceae bacterium]|nr:imelysin family protein [Terrimicrobiaceae bacterium]
MSRHSLSLLASATAILATTTSLVRSEVSNVEGVKSYLVGTVTKMDEAGHAFVKDANAYAAIIDAHHGEYAKAHASKQPEIDALVKAMQEDYKTMDSYGYETVEGIVGGVDSFTHYDRDLDAGVPQTPGAENVAEIVLPLRDGGKIDHQGCLFTYIIEPALWGGDKRWVTPLDLDGDGKIAPRESLPKVEVVLAAAGDVSKRLDALLADAKAWQPTSADCIAAMITMTPTLSDYFEDWKESRYSEHASGRFYAVSRVSDMRGIMGSCAIMYQAVNPEVAKKDAGLAKSIRSGFQGITSFLDKIEAREKAGARTISLAEIDEMASQAKEHTDKLVPQIEQTKALVEKN